MDFVIGKLPEIQQMRGETSGDNKFLEAQVLHVRPPRGRRRDGSDKRGDKERRQSAARTSDPPGSRVLVLLVSDAHRLPQDLAGGKYRVFLRFARS